jgi:hypothetical protein
MGEVLDNHVLEDLTNFQAELQIISSKLGEQNTIIDTN